MKAYADTWIENRSPQVPEGMVANYKPEPLEEGRSTGIWVVLGRGGMTTCCGSGSRLNVIVSQPQFREGDRLHNYSPNLVDIVLSAEIKETETLNTETVFEKLDAIRDAFGLSVASLAEILGASRASVYNWLENEPPTERFVQRIDKLYEIAQEWEATNPYHYAPGRLMKQKLGDGPSMHECLCREELSIEEIRKGMASLLILMNKQREKMDRTKVRSAKALAGSESHTEIMERLTGSVSADR